MYNALWISVVSHEEPSDTKEFDSQFVLTVNKSNPVNSLSCQMGSRNSK
jgi:hypothetical protein